MSDPDSAGTALRPYDPATRGGWSRQDAAHLLRRTQYGATYQEIEQAAEMGLRRAVERQLAPQPESAAFSATAALLRQTALDTGGILDLKAWWLYRMLYSSGGLAEKMSLFWHNHFATSYAKVQSVAHMAAQNDLIRRHALGDFRKLLGGMARDPAMLIWLDSNANRKRHANENLARELMELFSLGEGNYTEKDVQEAARAFTGWHVRGGKFRLNPAQHDVGEKTVLGRSGNLDGDDVVQLCLAQRACPRFLAGKLLRTLVISDPDEDTIDQLARRIRAHDFAIRPVLGELLASEIFFSERARSGLIKSPLDLVLGAHRALGGRADLRAAARMLATLGQDIFEPPTVKGWDGGRLWINSATMLRRANFAAELATGTGFGSIADPAAAADSHGWKRPEAAVRHYTQLLLGRDLDRAAVGRLVAYLREASGDRGRRLRGVIHLVMTMPEYQLG